MLKQPHCIVSISNIPANFHQLMQNICDLPLSCLPFSFFICIPAFIIHKVEKDSLQKTVENYVESVNNALFLVFFHFRGSKIHMFSPLEPTFSTKHFVNYVLIHHLQAGICVYHYAAHLWYNFYCIISQHLLKEPT